MSDRKDPIQFVNNPKHQLVFHESMTADKRNGNFAYLRKNALSSKTPGLYPAKDFYQVSPHTMTGSVRNVLGTDRDGYEIKIITDDGTTTRFYDLGGEGEANSPITASPLRASAFGIDGVYAATADGKVYRAEHVSSATTEVGALGTSWTIELGAWDDIYYWWIDPSVGIYRQLPSGNPLKIFNGALPGSLRGVAFFGGFMLIYLQVGRDIMVLWWDKADSSLFFRRTKIQNATFLAGGVVDGLPMLVYALGNSTNLKETSGELVVSGWDGENFARLNSIETGTKDISILSTSSSRQQTFSTGSEILLFAVDDNVSTHQPDLAQNYIYKVKKDGNIEVLAKPTTEDVSNDRASLVRVFHDFSLYVVNSPFNIYINRDEDTDYDTYAGFRTTEYISEFIGNPFNYHKMDGLNIAFERLFETPTPPAAPIPGNDGELVIEDIESTSMNLFWSKAVDGDTPQNQLEYLVVYSLTNNITSVEDAIANGTAVGTWTQNIATKAITGLDVLETYYVNVVVRDLDGNMAAYVPTFATTTPTATPWMSPTAWADAFNPPATPVAAWTNPGNAFADDGSFATASSGDERYVCYYDFGFAIPGGATILGFEMRIKAKYTANPTGTARIRITPTKGAANPADRSTSIFTGNRTYPTLTAALASYTRGNSADLIGTTWTPAEVNDAGFGFFLSGIDTSSPSEVGYALDHFEVRAFYAP